METFQSESCWRSCQVIGSLHPSPVRMWPCMCSPTMANWWVRTLLSLSHSSILSW